MTPDQWCKMVFVAVPILALMIGCDILLAG